MKLYSFLFEKSLKSAQLFSCDEDPSLCLLLTFKSNLNNMSNHFEIYKDTGLSGLCGPGCSALLILDGFWTLFNQSDCKTSLDQQIQYLCKLVFSLYAIKSVYSLSPSFAVCHQMSI